MKKYYPARAAFLFFWLFIPCISLYAQYYSIVGSAATTTGTTITYSYSIDPADAADTWFVSPNWVVTSQGTLTSNYLSSDKLTAYAVVQWNTTGTATVTFKDGTYVRGTKSVAVSCATVAAPAYTFGNYICGTSGSAEIDATPGANGNTVRWYTAATGGSYIQQAGYYITPVLTSSTTYYITSYNTTTGCESSPRTAVTVNIYPVPAAPATTGAMRCTSGSVTLAATPASGANSIIWYSSPADGVPLYTGTSYTTPSLNATTYYYTASYNTTAGCISAARTPVTATIATVAKPANVTDALWITGSGSMELQAAPRGDAADLQLQWYTNYTDVTPVATGSTYTTPTLTTTTPYFVRSKSLSTSCLSDTIQVKATVKPIISPASVQTDLIRAQGKKDEASLQSLTDAEKSTTLVYIDGMGRVNQQVLLRASPAGKDIVQPVEYDVLGRVSKKYAPYIPATTTGAFHSAYKTEQAGFYTAANDKVANDAAPYAVAKYEASPLGRLLEQGNIGQAWQPGTGHTATAIYSFNTGATADAAEEVRQLNADGTSTGFYAANTLSRMESKDENGNRQIVFSNLQGQTLAIKKQLDEVIDGVTVNWLETYYIYDDFGRVKCMIPPKGVVALKAAAWSFTQAIKDNYVHHFLFDKRGQLVQKKAPGQAWVYFVYDALGRLILTQDGLLRASNKWNFIKYDDRGRAIMQGMYKDATNTTRPAMQAVADALYTSGNATYPAAAWCDVRGTVLHGYTNVSFPKANADNTALEILGVKYYDSYDFDDADATADYTYTSQGLPGENVTPPASLYYMATGAKQLVLGTNTWLYSYNFYDAYGRTVQVRSNNHLRATVDNLHTNVYDFEGKVIISKVYHNAGPGKVTTVINKYTYDNQGRVLKIYQNNNAAAADQLVVQYEYNELGQVTDKKLHNTTGTTFLQSVDYRYTIRGQLESVNNAQLAVNASNNDETNDYFGMELLYNTADASLGNTAAYNGNISAVKWKGTGAGSGTADQRSYTYIYDKTDKLKTATSKMYTGSAWTKEAGVHNESIKYDHNGNITTLQRNDRQYNTPATPYVSNMIDNLTYTYNSSVGDQLLRVDDAATTAGGFANGASLATEYTYDVNGSMLTDQNKKISNIVYNTLGKPATILFSDNRRIDYIYDAAGNKLTMKTYAAGGALTLTTDYVNGFVYENNVLSFFGSPEGRVVNNSGTLEYQYSIADHQGNTRVVFTSATPAPSAPMATFEGDAGDNASQYLNINGSNIVPFGGANHTTNGSRVIAMSQAYKTGPARSIHVYPGDKVDIEVWEYHEGTSGYGTTSTPLATLIASVASAFGGVSGAAGESGSIYNGVNSGITFFGTGGNQGDARPAAYLNYILFDKNYNVLDGGWQLAPATTFTRQKLAFPTKAIKEEGYIYTWLSYDDDSNNFVYFDDFKVTHTKTNVIQYNDYYPFGLQASTSWTRSDSRNNFLYNEGSELNTSNGWYETFFRGYDAALARFVQVDPQAAQTHSMSPYQYGNNNPVLLNDPLGLFATTGEFLNKINELWNSVPDSGGKASWSDDGGDNGKTSWTVFVPDPGGGGGGLNVTYTRNGDGTITSNVSAAGSSGILYSTTILDDVEVEGAQQGGPRITGAVINTGALSGDNNCANCGFLSNGLGTNVRPDLGYFNGVEIQFNISGDVAGHRVVITRTRSTAIIINGQAHLDNAPDGPAKGNMQLNVVNGKVYSVDMPGLASSYANGTAYHSIQLIGNFTETATIFNANGNIVSQHSVQWNSSMQIGRSSPDGNFQYLGGSIGPGHVKIP